MRIWRRSRPFWGGLLLLIAGIELILIPVSGILLHGAVKLVIYIGIGGVFGVLIGILLVTCGVLLWLTPGHKTFYAIAGVVLALLSFITSNLGGFFLGMLLGITGGSLAYGWTPGPSADTLWLPGPRPVDGEHDGAAELLPGIEPDTEEPDTEEPDAEDNVASDAQEVPESERSSGGRHRGTGKMLAGATLPVVLVGSLLGGPAQPRTAAADPWLVASTAASVITAGSATLNGLSYQGAAKVPVAGGGTQTMMKFTLSSLILSGNVTATVTQGGQQSVTQGSTLTFTGGVTLYATKLSGSLLGIPITLTPGSVVSILLRLLNSLTPLIPVTMTNVTTDQPLVLAGDLQVAGLVLKAS